MPFTCFSGNCLETSTGPFKSKAECKFNCSNFIITTDSIIIVTLLTVVASAFIISTAVLASSPKWRNSNNRLK